jgi:methanogenic corrinoid protein MtbC1
MTRRNLTLSTRHDKMLVTLSKKLDISMTEAMQRAIELLEEKEARREKEVG